MSKKWNPDRCQDCRRGRPCPLPKKCAARGGAWDWSNAGPQASDLAEPEKSTHRSKLLVHTARIDYSGPDGLNVTRKSGSCIGLAFAPSWKILTPALDAFNLSKALREQGRDVEAAQLADRAWETYVHQYVEEMRASYRENRVAWNSVLSRERVTLLCYCVDRARCHRTVLGSRILVACGATYCGEVEREAAQEQWTH